MEGLIIVSIILLTRVLPIAAVVWAIVMLHRIRTGQDALRDKLDTIERLVRRP